jgi:hypothetical protein
MNNKNTLWCADGSYCDVPQRGIALSDKPIRFRGLTDGNHYLRYDDRIDGPKLNGWGGGILSAQDKPRVVWEGNGGALVAGEEGAPKGALVWDDHGVRARRIDILSDHPSTPGGAKQGELMISDSAVLRIGKFVISQKGNMLNFNTTDSKKQISLYIDDKHSSIMTQRKNDSDNWFGY